MTKLTIAKFGGNTLGIDGSNIPLVLNRIKGMLAEHDKVVAVFSAPFTTYNGKARSLTDIAIEIGRSYASSEPVDIDILRSVYEYIASRYMDEQNREEFIQRLDKFYKHVIIALKQAAEYKRFVDVTRARALAYSGELVMAYAMHHIMKSSGLKAYNIEFSDWPIITDDNFEAANFLLDASRSSSKVLKDMLEEYDVVCIGGFIGKTLDGLETTYERGGSDRTAADLAILLHDAYSITLSFEKDSSVLSADPKVVKDGLEHVPVLSYNEAELAGMFGMKILDPIAIKDIEDAGVDVEIRVTNMNRPEDNTRIVRHPESSKDNPIKIVTGRKRCCMLRMQSEMAWHLKVYLLKDRRYNEFVQLSPYVRDHTEYARLLFLDGEFVKRYERHIRAYDSDASIVYGRGVITLIGDEMWRVPNVAAMASSTVGEHGINILNMDAQEETSRIVIVVEDSGSNVEDAIRAIHAKRAMYSTIATD
ncbi:MAG: aspartate kinase [Candidatus Nitrosocaldus sp.]